MTTGTYTFLDDPAAGFDNGVEVTQITGISDSGEISGFIPMPTAWLMASLRSQRRSQAHCRWRAAAWALPA